MPFEAHASDEGCQHTGCLWQMHSSLAAELSFQPGLAAGYALPYQYGGLLLCQSRSWVVSLSMCLSLCALGCQRASG